MQLIGSGTDVVSAPVSSARTTELRTAPPEGRALSGPLIFVLVQLGLIALVVRRFNLESAAFRDVLFLCFAGFGVHHFLPYRHRLPFFLMLSVGAMMLVFGMEQGQWHLSWAFKRTACLLCIGCALIGVCHLPVSFQSRMALLIVVGCALAVARWSMAGDSSGAFAGFIGSLLSGLPNFGFQPLWPILGAMFMFRLMVYLYDIEQFKQPRGWVGSLAYFFLVPNVCFPLFPVIDYKTFCDGHYKGDTIRIYQSGVRWIVRGIVQIVLYRAVDYHLSIRPSELSDGADLVRLLVCNVGVYLHVSGQFHLIVGLLHLFGFNLPETNRCYFLASSFTDYWRRVNIYWKNFVMKVFYYPAYFRLKRLGMTPALVIATLYAFVATWLLHSYQWFWLRGRFVMTSQDTAFWGLLAVLVLVNAIRELKKGRNRTLGPRDASRHELIGLALRTGATFTCITVLWSVWTCNSLAAWVALWVLVDIKTLYWGAAVVLVVMVLAVAYELAERRSRATGKPAFSYREAVVTSVLPGMLLFCLGGSPVQGALPSMAASFLETLVSPNRPIREGRAADGGYYEDLMNVSEFDHELWAMYQHIPMQSTRGYREAVRHVDDFRLTELSPSITAVCFGETVQTNKWGMRDDEYESVKPAGALRIALFGSSHVMGFGVKKEQMFETIMEQRFNIEHPVPGPARYELMNCSVNGYSPLAQLAHLERDILPLKPDIALMIGHTVDFAWSIQHLITCVRRGIPIPYEPLRAIVTKARVDEHTLETWARGRLRSFEAEVVRFSYGQFVAHCRANGIQPIFAFLPLPVDKNLEEDSRRLIALAREAGFSVIDLSGVFANENPRELSLARWNYHSSPRAHAIVAKALYSALTMDRRIELRPTATQAAESGGAR